MTSDLGQLCVFSEEHFSVGEKLSRLGVNLSEEYSRFVINLSEEV